MSINPENPGISTKGSIQVIKTESAQLTHKGQVRDHNEDNLFSDPELGLWLVADGMGGHAGGDVASAIVCESIPGMIREGHSLVEAISSAHHMVKAAPANGRGVDGMGSTVVALQLNNAGYEIAWVGDSRAYLWNGKLSQLTTDQSFVQKLIEAKAISPEQARTHPKKNLILQSLGASVIGKIKVDTIEGQLNVGNIILLCSDGLNNELTDGEIEDILANGASLDKSVEELVNAANRAGGNDNIAVILIKAITSGVEVSGTVSYLQKVKNLLGK